MHKMHLGALARSKDNMKHIKSKNTVSDFENPNVENRHFLKIMLYKYNRRYYPTAISMQKKNEEII